MTRSHAIRNLLIVWLAWAIIMCGFQGLVTARFAPQRPDNVLSWTANETSRNGQQAKPYLLNSFLNEHVSWDSEFYHSIATKGYDDRDLRAVLTAGPRGRAPIIPATGLPYGGLPVGQPANASGQKAFLSLNYAFFPLYPYLMAAIGIVLRPLGLDAIATATLAGVLLSLLGTLAAMFALFDLVKDELGEEGGLRAAFYLLIFPTGFFLAQVYTEGLFVGLAFMSLALLRRRQLLAAGLLAALATWTRSVGVALVLPLGLAWLAEWRAARRPSATGAQPVAPAAELRPATGASFYASLVPGLGPSAMLLRALAAALPLLAFGVWWLSPLGAGFRVVEDRFFGRGMFLIDRSLAAWGAALQAIGGENTQQSVYYALEFAAVALALGACLATVRRRPGPALFGLLALTIAVFSGAPQSVSRYVLVVPSIFIVLAQMGRARAFDRGWTLASTLLMGLLATLFSFDMWVG